MGKCAQDVMQAHDIDAAAVSKCVTGSFVNAGTPAEETNTKLDAEIADRKELALLTLPTAIVNGRELRGQTQFGSTMEQNVARQAGAKACRCFYLAQSYGSASRFIQAQALYSRAADLMEHSKELLSEAAAERSGRNQPPRSSGPLGPMTAHSSFRCGAWQP